MPTATRGRTSSSPGARTLPKRSWCFEDFEWFFLRLTMPQGQPATLEPFWRFILKLVFRSGLVELLVLLPKGNGKTAVLAGLCVFHLLVTPNAQCFIVAADKEQADELYRFAMHYIESSGLGSKNAKDGRRLTIRESTKRILSRRDRGFIRVLASDKTKAGGKRHSMNPTLTIIEELHAHENDNAYVALRSAAFKAGGLVLDISTAGWDESSTLGRLRAEMLKYDTAGGKVQRSMVIDAKCKPVRHRDGRLTICESRSRRNVMLQWACTADDDLTDARVVKLANPASWVSVDSIEDAMEAPGITPWQFQRYRANVWTLAFDSWIPAGSWESLSVSKKGTFDESPYAWPTVRRRTALVAPPKLGIVEGETLYVVIDMARYRDSAAIVAVAPRLSEPKVWMPFVELSGGEDAPIAYEPVKDALRQLDETYRVLAIGFDPKYFDQAAQELTDEGLPMAKWPQTNERLCPASADLRRDIIGDPTNGARGVMRHDGDPVLRAHVVACGTRDVGPDLWRIARQSRTAPPIDGCAALAMAWWLAVRDESERSIYELRAQRGEALI